MVTRWRSCRRSAAAELPADIRLLDAAFDPAAELARFAAGHPQAGGIASFLGQVRAESGDAAVLELELSAYPRLTVPGMEQLAAEASRRWRLNGLLILHRTGALNPGEPIVLVAAAARHRRDAFFAADFAMDHLKSDAWFWKRERTAAGWRWIEPRAEDHADKARWRAAR
jgi:molybdopterin synthase catalytic subunit